MFAYLKAIWTCRYFWLSLVRMDLRARYRGSMIGIGWSMLHPVAMTIILATVFRTVFHQDPFFYVPFLISGLVFWQFIVTVSLQGCYCFFLGESYIRQYPAPMAIYPLRTLLGASFHFVLALIMVLVLTAIVRNVVGLLPLLSLLPTLLLLMLFGWGLATIFGLSNVNFRDTQHISEVGFQALFYLTPVMYPPEMFANRQRLGALLQLNPLAPLLELVRRPILYNEVPTLHSYMIGVIMVIIVGGTATLLLRSQERRVIFAL
jgi:ABC-type polysaccharide/polyol phosphate export permease